MLEPVLMKRLLIHCLRLSQRKHYDELLVWTVRIVLTAIFQMSPTETEENNCVTGGQRILN